MIAAGGGAIMDLCKLLGCKRPDTVHNLYFKRFPVRHEKDVIAIPTTCGTGSECTNISVAIVKDEKDGKLTGGEIMRFKNLVAGILGCEPKDAIPEMNALLQRILPLRPLRDCGFTEADFKKFPQSVASCQQHVMDDDYHLFSQETEKGINRK